MGPNILCYSSFSVLNRAKFCVICTTYVYNIAYNRLLATYIFAEFSYLISLIIKKIEFAQLVSHYQKSEFSHHPSCLTHFLHKAFSENFFEKPTAISKLMILYF